MTCQELINEITRIQPNSQAEVEFIGLIELNIGTGADDNTKAVHVRFKNAHVETHHPGKLHITLS